MYERNYSLQHSLLTTVGYLAIFGIINYSIQKSLILYNRKFRLDKIFANFTTCSHWWNINFIHDFLSCVNEDMATYTALVKIYSIK